MNEKKALSKSLKVGAAILVPVMPLVVSVGVTVSLLGGFATAQNTTTTSTVVNTDSGDIPSEYIPIYQEAADEYGVQWQLVAAIHKVETGFGTHETMISSAGAVGHFQFMPLTWVGWSFAGTPTDSELRDPNLINEFGGYGVDADKDGEADPFNVKDASFACAKYLKANGAPDDLQSAIFAYNHAQWYVDKVLGFYQAYCDGDYGDGESGSNSVGNYYEGDNETIEEMLSNALSLVGKSPYNWGGGREPITIGQHSFDCSSFVHWAYKSAGIELGNVSSVTTWSLLTLGKNVDTFELSELKPGDLVFFDTMGADTHVGIYLGGGKMVDDNSADGVSIDDMSQGYWKNTFNGKVRRIIE